MEASIGARENRKYLGLFVDLQDAIIARDKAETELGYHNNHGNKVSEENCCGR